MDACYTLGKAADGIWSIEERNVRAFLAVGGDRALLIDTGYGGGDLAGLVRGLTAKPVQVVLTHADMDHVGAAAQFDTVFAHPAEFDRYASRGLPGPPPKPLWEGGRLDAGGLEFEALLLPGHTPGSIALLERRRRLLIAGDTVQTAEVYMFGPGRSLAAYIHSLNKLWSMRDCFDSVLSSHGRPVNGPGLIAELRRGAERLLRGELTPQPLPARLTHLEGKCRLYTDGNVSFLH